MWGLGHLLEKTSLGRGGRDLRSSSWDVGLLVWDGLTTGVWHSEES